MSYLPSKSLEEKAEVKNKQKKKNKKEKNKAIYHKYYRTQNKIKETRKILSVMAINVNV